MKLPPKIRTYAFWVALSGAVVILVQSLGRLFGLEVEGSLVENVIMSICGVLVVLGIVSKPADSANDNNDNTPDDTSNTDTEI